MCNMCELFKYIERYDVNYEYIPDFIIEFVMNNWEITILLPYENRKYGNVKVEYVGEQSQRSHIILDLELIDLIHKVLNNEK